MSAVTTKMCCLMCAHTGGACSGMVCEQTRSCSRQPPQPRWFFDFPIQSHEDTTMAKGFTLWFTGLSGAGKSTLADEISRRLQRAFSRPRSPGRRRCAHQPVQGVGLPQRRPRHEHSPHRLRRRAAYAQRNPGASRPRSAPIAKCAKKCATRSARVALSKFS